MSSTEWMIASQVIRSCSPARISSVSEFSFGSSIQALGEGLDDRAVEARVGRLVDHRALVGALEVDRVDRAGGGDRRDQLVVPTAGGIELEAQARVAVESPGDRLDRRLLLGQAQRDDERHRLRLAVQHLGQRAAGLVQGEVEGRRLVGPAAVVARGLALGRRGPQVEPIEQPGEAVDRMAARQRQVRPGVLERELIEALIRHVLTQPRASGPAQPDDRGQPGEVARYVALQALERVGLELERQVGEELVGAHAGHPNRRTGRRHTARAPLP